MKRLVVLSGAELLLCPDAARERLHKAAMEMRESSGQDVVTERLNQTGDAEKYLIRTA